MPDLSRRRFLELTALGASASFFPELSTAADGAPVDCDLLIRGGELIDPGKGLRGIRDVAIKDGNVVRVARRISNIAAARVVEARGKIVVPGLIDLHGHVGVEGDPLGLPVDNLTAFTGVTTCVSAGDVGYLDFEAFRRSTLGPMRTRTFAFLHIAPQGLQRFPDPELVDMGKVSIERTAETVARHADVLLGIKVREGRAIVGDNGLEPLRRAIAAAEQAGGSARVMCHIGDAPETLSALLDLLRPGDILTHVYSGLGNNIVQNGKVLPAALEAKARGVIFDVGHGGGSFDFTIAEAAIDQGLPPDTISSDLHQASINTPGKPYLPWVMSKFLHLGFTLEDVIAMTTTRPAAIIGRVPGLGTLEVGAPADVTILEMVEEPCTFWDTQNHQRAGDRFLRPVEVVRAGSLMDRSNSGAVAFP